jgi:hypothetical protein
LFKASQKKGVLKMWEIIIHTRENQKGFAFEKTFKTEEEARKFSSTHRLAWRYNAYCTFQKKER